MWNNQIKCFRYDSLAKTVLIISFITIIGPLLPFGIEQKQEKRENINDKVKNNLDDMIMCKTVMEQ